MSVDLLPKKYDLPSIVQGDTYPAVNFSATGTTSALTRVRVKFKDSAGTLGLTLDSDSTGMTINDATAGAWDYDIDAISAATTAGLTADVYEYGIETTDAAGTVATHFQGTWEICEQFTD